jgi:MFS family permease
VSPSGRATPIGRVLMRRNFWPYFAGNLLSSSGTWFQTIAQVLLVYRMTRSPFLVGVVNFSQFAAVILLAPVAGSAADRFDRRRLVMATQLCAAALAAGLAFVTASGRATPAIVIAVALALGVTTALATPAQQAIVPGLVTRAELAAAVALNAVTFNLSRALGPVVGVFVIARYGIATALALNSASYLAFVLGLLMLTPRLQRVPLEGRPRVRDSVRMVRSDHALLVPLIVVGLVSVTADPVNTLTPAFSTEILGRPDTYTGFLVGAFGAGAVAAAFAVPGRRDPSLRLIVATLAALCVGMTAFALSNAAAVALTGLFVGGFGYLASVTAATSLLHLELEESHRGRVMALWSLSFLGSRPVASLIDGAIASLAGLRVAGLAMVFPALAGCLGLALLALRRVPQERGEDVEPRTTSSGSSSAVRGSTDAS